MTEEVTPDETVQRTMEDSICREARPEHIENTNTHSEGPKSESGEFQNGEKVSNEEQQSKTSDFANGLSNVVSPVSDNLQQGQSGQNLNTANYHLESGNSVRTPSRYPDKALEDGYNWRKYGQKLVKGNEFVRSYYRCTHPSCRAKRQVERSRNGPITDTVYIGKHEHDKPQSGNQASVFGVSSVQSMEPDVRRFAMEGDKPTNPHAPAPKSGTQASVVRVSLIQSMEPDVKPFATEEDKPTNPHAAAPKFHEAKMVSPQISPTTPTKNVLDDPNLQQKDQINHDGDQPLKKQKKNVCYVDEAPVERPYGEPRFVGEPRVVQTISEVDLLQDGYRWRKYGQKLVKGNPNPRSYYRCSSSGCPAKKHVERASHDVKVVITTYEGQHDHGIPPGRTVTPNRGGSVISTTTLDDETRHEPEEKPTVVHISAN